jgi:GntR family transcriptional regulator
MALERGPIPLYYQIARILRSQIQSQEYKPNDLLPTEEKLVRLYGVSRTTVRLAFQLLLNDGLVRRIAGRGTFVTPDRGLAPAEWAIGSIDEIISGYRVQYRLLGRRRIRAPDGLAKALRVAVGARVTEFRGIRLIEGQPFFHVTLHVPTELADRVPPARLRDRPLVALLEEHAGVQIVEAQQWTAASLADSEVARHLGLRPGDPVLLVERHFIDETGRVVELSMDRYRTDRVRHYLRILRRSASGPGRRPPIDPRGEGAATPAPARVTPQVAHPVAKPVEGRRT